MQEITPTIVSSIGYEVLSGKTHVERHDIHFTTSNSLHATSTLSLIC